MRGKWRLPVLVGLVFFVASFQVLAPAKTKHPKNKHQAAAKGSVRCGVERWAVKIGTDPGAKSIDTTSGTPVDISTMRGWKSPFPVVTAQLPKSSYSRRLTAQEKTYYTVTGFLKGYKVESGPTGDNDFHIVLRDESSPDNTIIVEIPHPSCAQNGAWSSQIAKARQSFSSRFTPTEQIQLVQEKIPVTVTGIGFFDRVHGQFGVVLKNAVEIHPVLSIEIGQAGKW